MERKLIGKGITILAMVVICIVGVIGLPRSASGLRENLAQNIKLGLDLRGGSHLLLQVQIQDAMKVEADQTMERLREDLRKANVEFTSMDRSDPASIQEADSIQVNVRGVPEAKSADLRRIASERYPSWTLTPVGATDYRMNLRPTELLAIKHDTVERTMRTIEQRINGLGLTEPSIQLHGRADAEYEILVQLPGVDDPARVKNLMQTAAMLEITEVRDGPFSSFEQAMARHGGVLPLNTRVVRMAPGRSAEPSWYLLNRSAVITGRDLRNARPGRDEFNRWETSFTLTQDGARRFGRFTGDNVGRSLAVVLDGQIQSVATIENRIEDSGRITGIGGEQEASDLALVLRAGSLPAGVIYLEERTIGPSLGADSIRQGVTAGLVGLVMVILVMLVYYRKSGVNAVIALLLNGVITLAVLGYFNAVWTLPGIAGLILSLGMAVDSNVLIFERIREELRAGKGIPSAVSSGFDRAFLTIIDTHVTTVVASAFLFMFGTGPVKGFAVTLVVGLVANLFTAVFVSRTMFDYSLYRNPRMAELSI